MVDYTYLRQCLSQQKWEVAEEETEKLMHDILGKTYDGRPQLFIQEFNDFPCKELKILDDLWLESSNYHFGFSIQASIYEKNNKNNRE
ncbi:GUN4 domain-containing protein [Oscillatoria acuminata]|uniref:GUN4 domain-containing protein n=1 Tax=Oscillatoria acuminata TaxID=118323 RepID=UPI0005C4F554|nr:GUN4 domain-containing protein [Oscillatoria acuminata]